jgi:asparagine synthase (glutamine-hydrolysing)
MKALATECARFEPFLPGHFYSSKQAKMTRWYNPLWREPTNPTKPYDKVSLISYIHTYILTYIHADAHT